MLIFLVRRYVLLACSYFEGTSSSLIERLEAPQTGTQTLIVSDIPRHGLGNNGGARTFLTQTHVTRQQFQSVTLTFTNMFWNALRHWLRHPPSLTKSAGR